MESILKRITLIEVLALILFLIIAIPTLFYVQRTQRLYSSFELGSEHQFGVWAADEFYVVLENLDEAFKNNLHVGLKEKDGNNIVLAELTHIYESFISTTDPTKYDVFVRILFSGRRTDGDHLFFKGKILKSNTITSLHFLDFPTSLSGRILRVVSEKDWLGPNPVDTFDWICIFRDVPTALMNKVKVGDHMFNLEGKVIARIQKKLHQVTFPASKLTINHSGDYLLLPGPATNGSFTAILRFWGEISQEDFRFQSFMIQTKQSFIFETPYYSLNGQYINIQTANTIGKKSDG
ncbi:MAG: hypothetical protein HY390_02445 [Deltaproteobacteria bacterium]|nr:hypothetical protein [Deltaproteobacteria bacterium]